MEPRKSVFIIVIFLSFLIGGCYTQLERSAVQIEDENEYYDETAEVAEEAEYDSDADRDADREVEYNYYFFDSPYGSYNPYYRPFSRFDALLYFNDYNFWMDYYTWWPVASYWPGHYYYHYDPWGYSYRHFGPYWWDHYYYGSGHHYAASRVPREQRPFVGYNPAVRAIPRGEKNRTDLPPATQKRLARTDGPNAGSVSAKRPVKSFAGQKTRTDQQPGGLSRGKIQPSQDRPKTEATPRMKKSKNTNTDQNKARSRTWSDDKPATKQNQPATRPSQSSTSRRSAAPPSRSSAPAPKSVAPPSRSSTPPSSSTNTSKSSNSTSKSSSGSSKKKN